MLTILIPAYNEEKRIAPTLTKLARWIKGRRGFRVIVVSDGPDSTAAICKEYSTLFKPRLQVLSFPHRIGKGAAILEGLRKSQGDVLSFDADSSLRLFGISKMQKKLGDADIVIASRRSAGSKSVGSVPLHRRVLSFLFNSSVRLLFGFPYSDTQCGYKLYSARAVSSLSKFGFSSHGYEWDVEMLIAARQLGLSVAECPVEWTYQEGGKARPIDLLRMIFGLFRLRLRYL